MGVFLTLGLCAAMLARRRIGDIVALPAEHRRLTDKELLEALHAEGWEAEPGVSSAWYAQTLRRARR